MLTTKDRISPCISAVCAGSKPFHFKCGEQQIFRAICAYNQPDQEFHSMTYKAQYDIMSFANNEGPDQPAHPCNIIYRTHWQTWRSPPLRKQAYSNILKTLQPKKENFQIKKFWHFFHISAQNIDCGYSLEPPRRGGSNVYPQSMFFSRNKKNNLYPCKRHFTIQKWVLRGSK